MLEAAKDRVIVGPAFGLVHNAVYEGEAASVTRDIVEKMHLPRKLEATCRTYQQMRKARHQAVVIGGDYGFKLTPDGPERSRTSGISSSSSAMRRLRRCVAQRRSAGN